MATRRKRKVISDDEAVEEEEVGSKKNKNKLDKTEKDKLVADFMRYTLFQDITKKVVKKAEIGKNITKEHSKITPELIRASKEKFLDIFGFDLSELGKNGTSRRHSIFVDLFSAFALVNTIENPLIQWGELELAETSLLMLVLASILLNNDFIEKGMHFFFFAHRLKILKSRSSLLPIKEIRTP
jgi:hypothetical protein